MAAKAMHRPYDGLSPEVMIAAIEAAGFYCDGRELALNSYENRVYQIGIEDGPPIVAKFYRPGRWTDEQINEEHAFAWELADQEIPVVPPMRFDGRSLLTHEGFRYAIYPRRGGRWPDLENPDVRLWLGRFLGRIHRLGSASTFAARPLLTVDEFGWQARAFLLENDWLPGHITKPYESLSLDLLDRIENVLGEVGELYLLRLHGDCHPGNILWTDDGPHFVDLDDSRMGPAVQDLWMLLSGERDEMALQLADILRGYQEFHDFDFRELRLIEVLRTLRMMHYEAWIARRWQDPAFPRAFPWFEDNRHWEEHLLMLKEQAALIDEMPLPMS
jgi:Ser/Thr protein kinase RdoA (MazF antagonist)